MVSVHLDAVASFVQPRGVVVAVPHVWHDDRRFAEVQAFCGGVVPSVMDYSIHLRDNRWLRKPFVHHDVVWHCFIGIEVLTYVHDRTRRQSPEGADQSLERNRIPCTKRTETHIDQRLVLFCLECRQGVTLLLPDAAFQILEPPGVERVASFEPNRLGVEQKVGPVEKREVWMFSGLEFVLRNGGFQELPRSWLNKELW